MSTPKGLKCVPQTLTTGDKILIYSSTDRIILQLRHRISSEEDLLEPSFKVAVPLTPAEAIAIASDLLNTALPQLAVLRGVAEAEVESSLQQEELDS